MTLRQDADTIINAALNAAQPDTAVRKALSETRFGEGKLVLIAAGKAAWKWLRPPTMNSAPELTTVS